MINPESFNREPNFPLIVNIKQNSLDDGPGIRSVIFFKGCPLSCVWCQNPETQDFHQELKFQPEKCIHCNPCLVLCPSNAIQFIDLPILDRNSCTQHFNCTIQCPADVFSQAGKYYEPSDLVDLLKSNKVFYDNTGGGVALSGGEPLVFPRYVRNIIRKLKIESINILLETSGFFKIGDDIDQILKTVDIIYYDIKILDPILHQQYCGVDNKIILENFKTFITKYGMILPSEKHDLKKEHDSPFLVPRIPLIPEITATEQNLGQIAEFFRDNDVKITDLLPYNPLWIDKCKSLGKIPRYTRATWLSQELIDQAHQIFNDFMLLTLK